MASKTWTTDTITRQVTAIASLHGVLKTGEFSRKERTVIATAIELLAGQLPKKNRESLEKLLRLL